MAHQQRANESEDQIKPDRRRERPGRMRPEPQLPGAPVHARPPQEKRKGEKESRHQPPAAFIEGRHDADPIFRPRRLERQPGELAQELNRAPFDGGQHVEPDDLEGREAGHQGEDAKVAEIDRSDLCVAYEAEPVGEPAVLRTLDPVSGNAHIQFCGPQLNLGENILVGGHRILLDASARPEGSATSPTIPAIPASRTGR